MTFKPDHDPNLRWFCFLDPELSEIVSWTGIKIRIETNADPQNWCYHTFISQYLEFCQIRVGFSRIITWYAILQPDPEMVMTWGATQTAYMTPMKTEKVRIQSEPPRLQDDHEQLYVKHRHLYGDRSRLKCDNTRHGYSACLKCSTINSDGSRVRWNSIALGWAPLTKDEPPGLQREPVWLQSEAHWQDESHDSRASLHDSRTSPSDSRRDSIALTLYERTIWHLTSGLTNTSNKRLVEKRYRYLFYICYLEE